MRIGELLIANGIITQEQLEEALQKQAHTRKKLGEILIDLGYISERQLVEVLEFQLGFPAVNMFDTPIDMAAAQMISESVAKKYSMIPIANKNGKLRVVMADPLNYDALEQLRLSTGMTVQPVIAIKSEIEQAISRNYGMQDSVEELLDDIDPMDGEAEQEALNQESPVVKLVNQMIQAAVLQKASDIHVDPQEKQIMIRYRVDGVLHTEKTLPKSMQGLLTARLKIIAKLNIAERRLPQDGRIQMQIEHKRIDIRVSTLPTVHGESVVLRILDQSSGIKKMSELSLSEPNLAKFEKMIQRPNGIVLISGPTGSGKTSTLYSVLHRLNGPEEKIITVEDPVEYRMDGVTQVQVNAQIGLTFASGLRSILRQDPNIVMVGEIRDSETAEIAVRASLTGHLVLSTIHTNGAVNTLTRLIDMGIDPYLIASSLNCVVAQRLVRRVCRECAYSTPAKEEELALFEQHGLLQQGSGQKISGIMESVVRKITDSKPQIIRGKGCGTCNKTGYKGRIAIHEVLVVDEPLRRLISQNTAVNELQRHVQEHGFHSLLYDGLFKVSEGITTPEEIMKAVSDE